MNTIFVLGGGTAALMYVKYLCMHYPETKINIIEKGPPSWHFGHTSNSVGWPRVFGEKTIRGDALFATKNSQENHTIKNAFPNVLGGVSAFGGGFTLRDSKKNMELLHSVTGSTNWRAEELIRSYDEVDDVLRLPRLSTTSTPTDNLTGAEYVDDFSKKMIGHLNKNGYQPAKVYDYSDDGIINLNRSLFDQFGRRLTGVAVLTDPATGKLYSNITLQCYSLVTYLDYKAGSIANFVVRNLLSDENTTVEVSDTDKVVLGCGLRSVQLLYLSGIGPKEKLEGYGIRSKIDLGNIGRKITHHPLVTWPCVAEKGEKSTNFSTYAIKDSVEISTGCVELSALWALNLNLPVLNGLFQRLQRSRNTFVERKLKLALRLFGLFPDVYNRANYRLKIVNISLYKPSGFGEMFLTSKSWEDNPYVNCYDLEDDADLDRIAQKIALVHSFNEEYVKELSWSTRVFHNILGKLSGTGEYSTVEKIKKALRKKNRAYDTWWHFTGGVSMGPDPESDIIDPDTMRFHKISNLYCIDATAFPIDFDAHNFYNVMMVGWHSGKVMGKSL